MTDQQPHTPTTEEVLATLRSNYQVVMTERQEDDTDRLVEYGAHFDSVIARIEAAAEQRGAIKALRRIAKDLEWLGAQGNIPTPDTSWQGVLECIRIINSEALTIEYRADLLEGDDE